MPINCQKAEVEAALHYLNIKDFSVYDYPKKVKTDGLLIASSVIINIWLLILIVWSIVLSCREPVENEFIKKDEEVRLPNDSE